MFRVFPATAAILAKLELFRCVEFAPLGHVILALTHGAEKPHYQSLFFFGHRGIITQEAYY